MDIVIIGGGAAGLCLAITGARENPKAQIQIIEKNDMLGKKLLATGNGKCNLSNRNAEGVASVLAFFKSIGLLIREENEGRLYPYSEQASSVVEVLEKEISRLGIQVKLNAEVERIEKTGTGFLTTLKNGEVIISKKVGVATGGKASPQFGTTGDGYRFARDFGHRITRLAPTLMPVTCMGEWMKVKGVRAKGTASLFKKEKMLGMETGEIQFTEEGLSGICIFNLSRLLKIEEGHSLLSGFSEYWIKLDLVSETTTEELAEYLLMKQKIMPEEKAPLLLHGILNNKLAHLVTQRALGADFKLVSTLTAQEIIKLSRTMKELDFQVTGGKGWKYAQCTSGGVALDEINKSTMESKIVNGLFFSGEIIDFDGPCGGYNLQNAWLNGLAAGHNIVKEV